MKGWIYDIFELVRDLTPLALWIVAGVAVTWFVTWIGVGDLSEWLSCHYITERC